MFDGVRFTQRPQAATGRDGGAKAVAAQTTGDDCGVVTPDEALGGLSPQSLAKRPTFGGRPATLRVPHEDGVPLGPPAVSPHDTTL
ncbi:hypothetical protein ACFQZP_44760 [Streptomyces lutosisoli]|uniref:Uncharacterized protein n=1 Tax=Streptomyces lutosisoli TaxID=2665721 RepID=A0ABW2VVS4_9ACTN